MITVTVVPGDTLSGIAASHDVSLSSVEAANPQIANPNLIFEGETVVIPSGGSFSSWTPGTSSTAHPATGNSTSSSDSAAGASPGTATSSAVPSWASCIVQRESGGNPSAVNSVPGYIGNGGGLFGDLTSTWNNYDGYHQPFQAPVSVQIAMNDQLYNELGLSPWAADGCPGT